MDSVEGITRIYIICSNEITSKQDNFIAQKSWELYQFYLYFQYFIRDSAIFFFVFIES